MSQTESTARCPTCDGEVPFGPAVVVSELITCRECGTDLEVTSLSPAAVAEAPMEEEDWGQ
jgi:alpha-aminoadipate/glutamate carrier protein LysW